MQQPQWSTMDFRIRYVYVHVCVCARAREPHGCGTVSYSPFEQVRWALFLLASWSCLYGITTGTYTHLVFHGATQIPLKFILLFDYKRHPPNRCKFRLTGGRQIYFLPVCREWVDRTDYDEKCPLPPRVSWILCACSFLELGSFHPTFRWDSNDYRLRQVIDPGYLGLLEPCLRWSGFFVYSSG